MTVTRLILSVAVLGTIALLLAQNWSPAVPLVFLGLQTQPIPLAIWMLLGAAAGALTSLLFNGLLQLSNRYIKQQRQTTSYESLNSPRTRKPNPREKESSQKNSNPPRVNIPEPLDELENTEDDDWDLDKNANDDWDFEERHYRARDSRSQYTQIQDDRDYEDFPESENDYEPVDSSYSYNKNDLNRSGIGKTESIYDVNYRVIVPPADSSTTSQGDSDSDGKDNDEDWGFLDEDFYSDKSSKPK